VDKVNKPTLSAVTVPESVQIKTPVAATPDSKDSCQGYTICAGCQATTPESLSRAIRQSWQTTGTCGLWRPPGSSEQRQTIAL